MIRIVPLHGHPHDPTELERYYRERHTPLVQRIPSVRNITFGRVMHTSDGAPSQYFLVSDVYFDDAAAFETVRARPEMTAALADAPNVASGSVTIMVCEYDDVPPLADASLDEAV